MSSHLRAYSDHDYQVEEENYDDDECIIHFDPHAPSKRFCRHDDTPPSTLLNISMDAFQCITEYLTGCEFQRLVHVGNTLLLRRMAHSWHRLRINIASDDEMPENDASVSLLSLSKLVSVTDAAHLLHLDVGVKLEEPSDITMFNNILQKTPHLQSLRVAPAIDAKGTLILPDSLQSLSGVFVSRRSQSLRVICGPHIHELSIICNGLLEHGTIAPAFSQSKFEGLKLDKLQTLSVQSYTLADFWNNMLTSLIMPISVKDMPSLTSIFIGGYESPVFDLPSSLRSICMIKPFGESLSYVTSSSLLSTITDALNRSKPLPLLECIEVRNVSLLGCFDDIQPTSIDALKKCAPNMRTIFLPDAVLLQHTTFDSPFSLPWQVKLRTCHISASSDCQPDSSWHRVCASSLIVKTCMPDDIIGPTNAIHVFQFISLNSSWLRVLDFENIALDAKRPIPELKLLEVLETMSLQVHFEFGYDTEHYDEIGWYRDTLPSNLRDLTLHRSTGYETTSPSCQIWLPRWLTRLNLKGVFPNESFADACGPTLSSLELETSINTSHLKFIAPIDRLLKPLAHPQGKVSICLKSNDVYLAGWDDPRETITRMRRLLGSLVSTVCNMPPSQSLIEMKGNASRDLHFSATGVVTGVFGVVLLYDGS